MFQCSSVGVAIGETTVPMVASPSVLLEMLIDPCGVSQYVQSMVSVCTAVGSAGMWGAVLLLVFGCIGASSRFSRLMDMNFPSLVLTFNRPYIQA